MRFSDMNCFVDLGCFEKSGFYDVRLEEIPLNEVQSCLNRIELMDGASARHDAFHRLQIAAEQAEHNGWVKSGSQLLPDPLSNISEASFLISRFERGERAAILFALSEDLSLLETITMKRSDLRGLKLSTAAAQIADRLTPHLHCDWLFWRESNGLAIPLSNLPGRWRQKMPMSWEQFRQSYQSQTADVQPLDTVKARAK
ncbi:hypothetical protein [Spongiibacter sp.]|uniref:hypothetical protein n=1 Tax=Spongiibacter sp. TaxID=2024860 RepID=UPI00356A7C36